MKLVVGCPIRRREWIVDSWLKHVEAALPEGVDVTYLMVGSRSDPTRAVADKAAAGFGRTIEYADIIETQEERREHAWYVKGALERMSALRNILLEDVRRIGPDLFLSLDSDILCHPQQISNLIETLGQGDWDAVGGKAFLSSGVDNPSWCFITSDKGMKRYNIDYVTKVDVIMAIKLMTPAAYEVDYVHHMHGEDIGWSLACAEQGLQLAHDGRVASKHVMHQFDDNGTDLISKVDARCGF